MENVPQHPSRESHSNCHRSTAKIPSQADRNLAVKVNMQAGILERVLEGVKPGQQVSTSMAKNKAQSAKRKVLECGLLASAVALLTLTAPARREDDEVRCACELQVRLLRIGCKEPHGEVPLHLAKPLKARLRAGYPG